MELCQVLREYMLYVEKMRRYAKVMGLNGAAEKTVIECIREGILEDFLRQNREEAVAMSIFEYDEERELKLLRKAQFEYGRESLLKSKIITKLKKGKSLEQIAEDLEEELPAIEKLVRRMKNDGEYPA